MVGAARQGEAGVRLEGRVMELHWVQWETMGGFKMRE